jgi:hypothetical protein
MIKLGFFGFLIWVYLHACTTTFDSKEDLVEDAKRKELRAYQQESNYWEDGEIEHLWGAAEYYKDAIKLYLEAIRKEDGDTSFDESTNLHIESLQRKIKDYYSY